VIPAGWHQRCRLHDIDSWRRRADSRADEQEHEQEKGMMNYFLFFLATVQAGTINALAGGGGLITFPLLMLVVTPVTADATSAVALFFAYPTAVWRTRDQLAGVLGRRWLWLLLIPSVLGGLIGAVLLSRTENRNFIQLVPWLVLSGHCYHCAAADPDSTRRKWQRASGHRGGVVALSQLRAFFWWHYMAATSAPGLASP
jgi:uncharacterized membrane protein YfcA